MSPRKEKKGIGRGPIPSSLSLGAESDVMTLQQVADYLHCNYDTANKLARQGAIPGFGLGGNWRFLKSELDKWIAQGGGRPPSNASVVRTEGGRRVRKPISR
jgi:excisionase family DNA binding protein